MISPDEIDELYRKLGIEVSGPNQQNSNHNISTPIPSDFFFGTQTSFVIDNSSVPSRALIERENNAQLERAARRASGGK